MEHTNMTMPDWSQWDSQKATIIEEYKARIDFFEWRDLGLANKWISEPRKEKVNLKNPQIARKVTHYKHVIDYFIKTKTDDIEKMNEFKDRLKNMRSASIQKGGEFSVENLVFKELRNSGYLDKFSDYIIDAEDKKLSLKGK